MVAIFASADEIVNREQISQWLKKDSDEGFVALYDLHLAIFLNGFINQKRGKKSGPQMEPEKRLTNNIILTKLKIALNLQAEELISLLETVDFRMSKPELSAFTRKVDHKHYRECKDQVLRNLLQAIDKKHHVERTGKIAAPKGAKPQSPTSQNSYSKKTTKKPVDTDPYVEGARPNASNIYNNPKATTNTKRTLLKLSK